MLKQLTLKEFQAHRRLVVEFSPAVTVLTGSSDAGKSSIIRALRWLATNRPAGDGFIRRGGGSLQKRTASASLRIDGHTLKRVRGQGRNLCRLDDQIFKALGSGVPVPVKRLLNLGSVNFQSQHDPHFLLSLSSGQAALALNEVVNLAAIDRVQSHLASELRKVRAEAEVSRTRLAEARARRDALAWVREADAMLQTAELASSAVSKAQNRVAKLTTMLGELFTIREAERKRQGAKPALSGAVAAGARLQAAMERVAALEHLLTCTADASKLVQSNTKKADQLAAQLAAVPCCPVCGAPKKS